MLPSSDLTGWSSPPATAVPRKVIATGNPIPALSPLHKPHARAIRHARTHCFTNAKISHCKRSHIHIAETFTPPREHTPALDIEAAPSKKSPGRYSVLRKHPYTACRILDANSTVSTKLFNMMVQDTCPSTTDDSAFASSLRHIVAKPAAG